MYFIINSLCREGRYKALITTGIHLQRITGERWQCMATSSLAFSRSPWPFFFFFLNLCSKGIRTVPDAGDNWKEEWGKFCDNPHPDK